MTIQSSIKSLWVNTKLSLSSFPIKKLTLSRFQARQDSSSSEFVSTTAKEILLTDCRNIWSTSDSDC